MASNWFVEESLPDGSYKVVARNLNEQQALEVLNSYPTDNRLEMWSDCLAASPKGFAPAAFRNQNGVKVGNTLRMLFSADH